MTERLAVTREEIISIPPMQGATNNHLEKYLECAQRESMNRNASACHAPALAMTM